MHNKDLRAVVVSENVIPEITPYLLRHVETLLRAKEANCLKQDSAKRYADNRLREQDCFRTGDKVLVETHTLSKASAGFTAKFAPRRDGPYIILKQVTPTSFEVAATNKPTISVGKFHVSALRHFIDDVVLADPTSVRPIQGRGRPKKSPRRNPTTPGDDKRSPHATSHPSSSRPERQKRIPRRFRDGSE
ncbi:hypothetical protein JTB14_004239 [Gonioctena quinquepunctata]|nr:hypothetical protein JTB14_004239 [Gonioctena quinquepunctata]